MKKTMLFTALTSMVLLGASGCNKTVVPTYKITWLDYDKSVLRVDNVAEGTLPSYGSDPTLDPDAYYKYEFTTWTPKVEVATKDASYIAVYQSSPITEINKETYDKAKNFYGKNYTVNIKRYAGYEETITHNEKNEYYGVYTLDGVSNYRAFFNDHDDVVTYFTGEVHGEQIEWTEQINGKVSELTRYAFDQNRYIESLMHIDFDDLTYDSVEKCYKGKIGSEDWIISFSGERLLSAVTSFGGISTTLTFTDYDETKVVYDQALRDYVINAYQPSKETLKSIIDSSFVNKYPHDQNDAVNGDLEFHLTYYVDGVNMEYYKIHLEQMVFHFLYDGATEICGVTEGGFVFVPYLCWEYVLDSGITYVYTDEYHSNPYNENTIGTRSRKGIELIREAIENIDAWEDYSATSGLASFSYSGRHYAFEIELNVGGEFAWCISKCDIHFNDGEKDIEYIYEYINTEFDFYDDGDIEFIDPE